MQISTNGIYLITFNLILVHDNQTLPNLSRIRISLVIIGLNCLNNCEITYFFLFNSIIYIVIAVVASYSKNSTNICTNVKTYRLKHHRYDKDYILYSIIYVVIAVVASCSKIVPTALQMPKLTD